MGVSMISANILSGPYLEPFLQAAIDSTKQLCDEWVFIDTAPGHNPNREVLDTFRYEFNFGFEDCPKVRIIDMPRGEDKDFSFSAARELARVNSQHEWVLRLDADEVLHEKDIEVLKKMTDDNRFSAIEIKFAHLMCFPWLVQYYEAKQILFRKDKFHWERGVHELPIVDGRIRKEHDIMYVHFGYCRGDAEVFLRWKLYTDIDGKPDYYAGVNPNTILQDRISVCQNFPKERHPKVVYSTLDRLFPFWRDGG